MIQARLFEQASKEGYWIRVVATALESAQTCMAPYGSRFSRHDFTQRQHLVILVLKTLQKTTYRGICDFLHASSDVRDAMGLKKVPHYTTIQKFADRAEIMPVIDAMLADLTRRMSKETPDMAIDSTGIESTCASRYYVSKRSPRESRYIKVSVAVLCGLCVPCAVVVDWGPGSDITQAPELIDKAMAVLTPRHVYMDKGYDCEGLHEQLRDRYGVESVIPPVGRGPNNVVKTKYRSLMRKGLPGRYGLRWHSETVMSSLKRMTGPSTSSRGTHRPLIEAALKVLAYTVHR